MKYSRRSLLRASTFAAASAGLPAPALSTAYPEGAGEKSDGIELKMSGYPFEHVLPLAQGKVQVKGLSVNYQMGRIGDLNSHVFSGPQTLDVTEIGLTPFILAFANEGFRAYSLIPVFPLRTFRHKSIFVRSDSGIVSPQQLKGKRIGTPGYSSTSLTWIRGMVQDEFGVRPEDVEWVLSAEDSAADVAGEASAQEQVFPEGLTSSIGPAGKDESDMLLDGDVDALFHAAEPRAFVEGNPEIRRLFADPRQVEREYFAKTGIFPMMHAVAIRTDLIDRYPWLPKAVFESYSKAKAMAYSDIRSKWFLRTLPWFAQELESTEMLMGENYFPYGLEANRKALDTLFRYSFEQGLAVRRLAIEEMFLPSTLDLVD